MMVMVVVGVTIGVEGDLNIVHKYAEISVVLLALSQGLHFFSFVF